MREFHGHSRVCNKSRTYSSWCNMKSRCTNPDHHRYYLYGALGIKVCERWDSFVNFLEDMGERPEGKTLDRIDGTKDYEPSNCKWSTPSEQGINRKTQSNNTSGKKGVAWNPDRKKWIAQGNINKTYKRLYYGTSFEEACAARDAWEVENGILHYE